MDLYKNESKKKQHINLSIKTNCYNLNHMCNDEHGD